MKFSEAWLRTWVHPPVDTQTLGEQLTMAGLEVDGIEPAAPEFSGVYVGLVQQVDPHPNAEKLRVCQVDLGQGEPLSIVCGAPNVAAQMRVPVAIVGARLPGGHRIQKAKLRGQVSQGMICSAAELGLAESSSGILSLPADAPLGMDVREYLALEDACIEIDLTPDRGDCLSIAGIAREVGVLNRCTVRAPAIEPIPPATEARIPVQVQAPEACPRYVCRVIQGIDPRAETPLWMQERLRRSGLRALHPVVDVTNYVMLELGQPMHGFDLAKLQGEIQVRLARAGEALTLLNGETLSLEPDTLVIADQERPIALAGIMGGAETGVSTETRSIVLESAFFSPHPLMGKARRYGLHTDSSHRFERGVDPEGQVRALERATALLLDIAGGQPGPLLEIASEAHLPQPNPLHLRRSRIQQVLGVELAEEAIEDILHRLGMALEPAEGGWQVLPPSGRFDLVLEVDLIAEIGRIHGYDHIPTRHAITSAVPQSLPESAYDLHRARTLLVARGYYEAITYSFVSPELQRKIDPEQAPLALANPLSAELSVMRTSLWPGLLQVARSNRARQQERIRLFEIGLRFRQAGEELHQEKMLAGLALGSVYPEQWGSPKRTVDFFDLKGDVEALLSLNASLDRFRFIPMPLAALHPGQSARIVRGDQIVGHLGLLHPALAAELDLPESTYLFELLLPALETGQLPRFSPISRYPAIRRDLAILVDQDISYDQVRDCVLRAETQWLQEVFLFDLYQGEKIDSGQKSLALGLILQAPSQTLTEQEIDASLGKILAQLREELGATLRE